MISAMPGELVPIRRQYLRIKQEYPDAILFFRLGDFYETFEEDAKTASRVLEIALTSREMGKGHRLPMAGIPAQALEHYLAKLVSQGYKVAICDQMEDASALKGRKLVRREVRRLCSASRKPHVKSMFVVPKLGSPSGSNASNGADSRA